MANITLHQFSIYDITTDEPRKSRRWGTVEGIERVRGTVISGTATVVDSSVQLDGGLTARNFEPSRFLAGKPANFPTKVVA